MMYTPDTIPNEIAEEIFEALYAYIGSGGKSTEPFTNVSIWELHKFNPINYGACGTYYKGGEPLFDFEIRDGDWNGSEILKITDPEELSSPKRYGVRYIFAPDESKVTRNARDHEHAKALMERARTILRNNPTMQKKQGEMSYDLTMCPANKTRDHWRDYAASFSAVIEAVEFELD